MDSLTHTVVDIKDLSVDDVPHSLHIHLLLPFTDIRQHLQNSALNTNMQ